MSLIKKNFIYIFIIFILAACCSSNLLFARIDVIPEISKITAEPGKKIKGTILITKTGTGSAEVFIQPEDWSGGVKADAHWLEVKPDRMILKPGKEKKIKWKAEIPQNAQGDIIAKIYVAARENKQVNGLGIGMRIACGLYITVKGTERPDAELSEISVSHSEGNYGLSTVFQNTGNVHLTTQGVLVLLNKEKKTRETIEMEPHFFLSGESTTLLTRIDRLLSKGKYEVFAEVYYTAPSGLEKQLKKSVDFIINNKGEISK